MREVRVPSDTIKAIFRYLGRKRFSADIPRIHRAFYSLSRKSKFSNLFRDFIFDDSRSLPYSPTVRYALDRLQKSNLLSCINPGLDDFEVSEILIDWDIEESELFSAVEIKLLEEAAIEFREEMQTPISHAL